MCTVLVSTLIIALRSVLESDQLSSKYVSAASPIFVFDSFVVDPSPQRSQTPWPLSGLLDTFVSSKFFERFSSSIESSRPHDILNLSSGYVRKFPIRLSKLYSFDGTFVRCIGFELQITERSSIAKNISNCSIEPIKKF